GFGLFD
nr:Chain P, P11 peptide [Escherichia coli]7U6V_P Chain P, C-terminal domain (CTD) from the Ribosomal P-stalk [Saccharomyces cerevisiae]